jgi:hypothetical protein
VTVFNIYIFLNVLYAQWDGKNQTMFSTFIIEYKVKFFPDISVNNVVNISTSKFTDPLK